MSAPIKISISFSNSFFNAINLFSLDGIITFDLLEEKLIPKVEVHMFSIDLKILLNLLKMELSDLSFCIF